MAIKVNGTTVIDDSRNLVNIVSGLGGSPAGSIVYHAANSPPTGFIKANGAAISRTTYADLFSAIGTTFGAGDGSTTFLVPDLRGEFLRGWDDSRGIDTGRGFGTAQADEFKSHNHNSHTGSEFPYYGRPGVAAAGSGSLRYDGLAYTGPRGGTETRPRNVALLACIKF
tara:strand:- start:331 stop:837 length:507 start_codon:yes stop_codon:yes gene_type:complete